MKLKSNSFCSAPWFQIRNDIDGRFRSCCQIDHSKTQFSGRTDYRMGHDSLSDWLQSDYLQYLRKELTNGNTIPECEQCWQKERNGLRSLRHVINHSIAESSNTEQGWVHFYLKNKNNYSSDFLISADVKLSNVCNFSCAMCNPLDSTKIYSIWSKNKTHPMVQFHMQKQPDILDQARSIFVDNKNIEFLKEVLDHDVRHLKILGGEPLLDLEMLDLLSNLDINRAKKITLSFVTNGSIDLTTVRDRLNRFRSVIFIISLEGTDRLQDYIRRGSDWNFLERNLSKYIDRYGCNDVYVSYTLQALTLLGLPDLIAWCEKYRIPLNIGVLDTPDYLSLNSVPDDIKKKAIERIEQSMCKIIPPLYQTESYITLPGLISLVKEFDHNIELTKILKKFVDWYDPNMYWQEILPEWKPYL